MKSILKIKILLLFIFLSSEHSRASSYLKCTDLFSSHFSQQLSMLKKYEGEHLGLYYDKTTHQYWHVKYFNETEKAEFKISIANKILLDSTGRKASSPFDSETGQFKEGLIILDTEQNIYLLPYEQRGIFHHSSLSHGQNVFFAGTVSFSNGHILTISDLSGHYKPKYQSLVEFIRFLEDHGLNLRQTKISGYNIFEKTGQYSISYFDWKKLNP